MNIYKYFAAIFVLWRCVSVFNRSLNDLSIKYCQMVDKPGFVTLSPALATIHLERLLPAASSNLPGHDAGPHLNGVPFSCPYMVLLRMGFTMPVLLPVRRCALTAPFHPYHGMPWRYFFCGTFPRVAPAGHYPAS